METIYLDYNATTPVRDEVRELMERVSRECYGNPSSAHLLGRMSKACIEDARRKVAESLGCDASEVLFTSGGSEGDNIAIKGTAGARTSGHVITTCIEHSAVRRSCEHLEKIGFEVTCLPVDRAGRVDPQSVREAIRDDTFLVTVMWANNETGQIQPVEAIAEIARDAGITFHTDAVQAFGKIPVNVQGLPVDLLAVSGHKFYAPKGVGVLYVRDGIELVAQTHGGGQEMGLRSGTENVAGIAALGEACRLAVRDLAGEATRLSKLRDTLEAGILERVPKTVVNGDPENRVPNTSNISFRGVDASQLVGKLDEENIAVSGASACHSGKQAPSRVLTTGMGMTDEEAGGAIRFSLGRHTEERHVTRVISVLPGIVESLRGTRSRS